MFEENKTGLLSTHSLITNPKICTKSHKSIVIFRNVSKILVTCDSGNTSQAVGLVKWRSKVFDGREDLINTKKNTRKKTKFQR